MTGPFLVSLALYLLTIGIVAVIAWNAMPADQQDEPMEFSATYDALAAQRAQVDQIKRKSHAAEKLIVAQAAKARLGPVHEPVEL